MYCLTVTYPAEAGKRFDLKYYTETHIPLCQRLFSGYGFHGHILRLNGGAEPGQGGAFFAEIDLLFETHEQLARALAEQSGALQADLAHYTDVQPSMCFSDVAAALTEQPQ